MPEFDFWPGIALAQLAHPPKVPATSQGCTTNSPTRQQTHDSSSTSYYLHLWCIPHNLCFVTKSPVWRLSSRILQAFSYSSDHPKNSEDFYCRNVILATNNISRASAPHRRCQHPTKGALLLAQAKRTRNISSASSYHRSFSPSHDLRSVIRPTPHKIALGNLITCWHLASQSTTPNEVTQHLALLLCWCTSHDFLASTTSCLASHLIRSNLPYLSPSKPSMNFYLISQMTSAHLTSNSMLCTTPSCVPEDSSALP